ncbi:fungal protein [Schizosaccharomyces cryophilus OY26]|uniref:Fungal protein n=1 Tax=Schizosaccharomyces cryophilus (strain OY26 / ATCC MYA-4695 / CBS 11777 / NBRC 106824 / NRRL Y48691) TaxID=653667 RepID=S9VY08_SCHCR|nr:uncharacterized protein SPOG_01815 [Schizosaccharomyces cryophilus OY26]EPY52493.1 fungal protein [Schizosaccharomyces cryophilus OY26]
MANQKAVSKTENELSSSPEGEIGGVIVEHLCKRIRNFSKKKQKIIKLEEQAAKDPQSLNADQKNALRGKDAVLTTLHELEELLSQINSSRSRDEKKKRQEVSLKREKEQKQLEAKYEEGFKSAQKQVSTLVRFLRFASHNCVHPSDDQAFNTAVEKLLIHVYEGSENSEKAVANLSSSSEEYIDETEVPYKLITAKSDEFFSTPAAAEKQEDHEEAEEQAASKISDVVDNEGQENALLTDEHAHQTTRPLNRGIQFLNESEIEGQHFQEPATFNETSVPANTEAQVPVENVEANDGTTDPSTIYPTQFQAVEQQQMQQAMDSMSPDWYQPTNEIPQEEALNRGYQKRSLNNRPPYGNNQRNRGRGPHRGGGRGRGGSFNRFRRNQYPQYSNDSTSRSNAAPVA